MSSEPRNDASTLGWVRKELNETLQQAAQALDEYAEDPSDRTQLRFCVTYLHQVYGTLQMLELYGLSMLVEEMEHVLDGLINGTLPRAEDGQETLMQGILSVPDYLERIQQGERDSGVLVLGLLNDLRAARGASLLTESMLFAPDLDAPGGAPRTGEGESEALIALARRHRPVYQRALLAYIRGQSVARSLERMQAILDELDAAAGEGRLRDLWWIAGGLVEGLRHGDLAANKAVNTLLGQLDRQLRSLIEQGEAAPAPPDDLLKNMLYYVGQAGQGTERIRAIQSRFQLADLLPGARGGDVADGQGGYRPGADILESVSDALREDVTGVKDALDLYVRGEQSEPERLAGVADTLRRVADTLGMLGLGVPRRVVREQIDRVEQLAAGRPGDESELMEFARALLYVESALDGLGDQGQGRGDAEATMDVGGDTVSLQDSDLFDLEYRAVYHTAIGEAVSDISALKEALVAPMEGRGEVPLEQLDTLLLRLQGAFDMLDLRRAGRILDGAGRCIRVEVIDGGGLPAAERLDHLADAITSLEYYLEAVLENRGGRDSILEVAENSVAALGYADTAADEEADASVAVTPSPADASEPGADAPDGGAGADPGAPAAEGDAPAPAPATGRSGGVDLEVAVRADAMDEEILEIFLEETDECLETLRAAYPRWRADPEQHDDLITVRRMFHTLKGSGRLAGALLLGELAWSAERLLNRIIDGHVAAGPEVFAVLDATLDAVPALAAELQGGAPPTADVRAIMREATRLADGDPPPDGPDGAPEPGDESAPADDGAGDDGAGDVPPDAGDAAGTPAGADRADAATDDAAPEIADAVTDRAEDPPAEAPGESGFAVAGEGVADGDGASDEAPAAAREQGDDGPMAAGDGDAEAIAPSGDEPAPEEPEAAAPADDASAGPGMDATLYEIFRNESEEHLGAVRGYLEACERSGDAAVTEDVLRALHTLSGSARMADVRSVATLARELELLASLRRDEHEPLTAADREALREGHDILQGMVTALGRAEPLPDAEGLREELAILSASPAAEGGEAESGDEGAAQEPGGPERETIDPDLVELFLEEAEDILGFLDGTLERWESAPESETIVAEMQRSLHTLKGGARLARFDGIGTLCHALETVVNDLQQGRLAADDEFFAALRDGIDALSEGVTAARDGRPADSAEAVIQRLHALRGGSAAGAPPAGGEDDTEGDRELVEVFLQEASEILQAIETAQQAWTEAPDDGERIHDLERALHTLKGGARMAGYPPIANLSHALEALLVRVREGEVAADAPVFELLERCHDRLHLLREQAEQGAPLAEADDLLGEIAAPRAAERTEEAPPPEAEAERDAPAPAEAGGEPAAAPAAGGRGGGDQILVRADLLDNLVNYAGEVSISRARLDQHVGAFRFNLSELNQTVQRLRDQLRTMEIETEAQILYRYERESDSDDAGAGRAGAEDEQFDPLELDRFSRMQELSRGLGESVNDLASLESLLDNLARESETLLLQQSRVNTELQDGLMRTRMVPFASLVPRLRRIVRQTAAELGREARIRVQGAQGEMDRTVLDRVVAPLEHMLRNAVAHGIETPEARRAAGKPAAGEIRLALDREGADVVLRVSDDGAGMDLDAIRRKARERGLLREDREPTDREVMQFVLEQGFSTAAEVTQVAGRGVGMDVVNAEIKQLGGSLDIGSERGTGTWFTVRLPFTLAMNQALLCTAGEQAYAIPLTSIDGVVRVTRDQMETYLSQGDDARYHYAGQDYQVTALSLILGEGEPNLAGQGTRVPLVLLQSGDYRLALQVDSLIGSREIVVKSVGPQIAAVPGIYGATILADGRVVLILEMSALMRQSPATLPEPDAAVGSDAAAGGDDEETNAERAPQIMVVDDSITMRKVATRLLERNHMEVVTASDGVDAVARLQDHVPDAMLLDIEMPRMDGYELATHMRNDPRLQEVPIIMITSRTGEKHRQRALEIGVDHYLGKPYQESDLLGQLHDVLQRGHGRD